MLSSHPYSWDQCCSSRDILKYCQSFKMQSLLQSKIFFTFKSSYHFICTIYILYFTKMQVSAKSQQIWRFLKTNKLITLTILVSIAPTKNSCLYMYQCALSWVWPAVKSGSLLAQSLTRIRLHFLTTILIFTENRNHTLYINCFTRPIDFKCASQCCLTMVSNYEF